MIHISAFPPSRGSAASARGRSVPTLGWCPERDARASTPYRPAAPFRQGFCSRSWRAGGGRRRIRLVGPGYGRARVAPGVPHDVARRARGDADPRPPASGPRPRGRADARRRRVRPDPRVAGDVARGPARRARTDDRVRLRVRAAARGGAGRRDPPGARARVRPHAHAYGPPVGRNRETREAHSHGGGQVGILAACALVGHSFIDGLSIGLGFQSGTSVGAFVALAVVTHDFADGFNTFTAASLHRDDRRPALVLLVADALAPIAGAAVTLLVTVPKSVLGPYLGLFGGVLLYLAAAEILPEAHSRHPRVLTLCATGLGLLVVLFGIGFAD
nr:ZIP family metal transporter [Actinomadura sp. J1-007]